MIRSRYLWRVSSRQLAVVAALLLLVPPVACQCADGRIRPFCLPLYCLDSASQVCHATQSCCSGNESHSCCQQTNLPGGPTASKTPCCRLIVQDQAPITLPTVSEGRTVDSLDVWFVDPVLDCSNLAVSPARLESLDFSPPPLDLVIVQLRLTI
jgi:hypothetical protein